MIFMRWGGSCRIVAKCGDHPLPKPRRGKPILTLVKVEELDDDQNPMGKFRFYFADFLKAYGGWREIYKAIEDAPTLELSGKELKAALREAM